MARDLVIGMAGSGGDGIVSAGESLIAAAASEGYHAMMTKSFGSQIRGGESSCRVRVSVDTLFGPGGLLDVAVSLDWDDFLKFGAELPVGPHTVVIYEERSGVAPDRLPLPGIVPEQVFAVPMAEMAKQAAGTERAKNSVVLGLLAQWFGIPAAAILRGIAKTFADKGAPMREANERAFELGRGYAVAHPLSTPRSLDAAPPDRAGRQLLLDGNEMCAQAALFAKLDVFGGYPITPSTEVMQILTKEIWKHGGSVLQCEDEIAGIGVAVGASFAGKKAMTATSGPGMSLKTEMLGLATLAELPLVLLNVQRGGPSTGSPTKPEQSDLFAAAFSAHGDVLRPVLAPTSVADTFAMTVEAFNLAEQFQTPVIILSDQEIAQRKETVEPFDLSRFTLVDRKKPGPKELENYMRFADDGSGISPISHPGMLGGTYLAAGIEHNEHGDPTASGKVHARMNQKRFKKLAPLQQRRDLFIIEGDPRAPLALVAWGSVGGVCREAMRLATAQRLHVKLCVPQLLYPVAEAVYREFFEGVQAGLVVEQSHQGQLYRILRSMIEVPAGLVPLTRSGANPFQPIEVLAHLRELAMALQQRAGESQAAEE